MAVAIDISGSSGPGLVKVFDAEAITEFSGTSGQADTTEFYQGNQSYTYQSGKSGRTSCTFIPSTNQNWTSITATEPHFYFSMKCGVFAFAEAKTTGTSVPSGLTVRVQDSAGDYKEWHVAGSDTWNGSWKQFAINLTLSTSDPEIYASSGTLDLTDIDIVTWSVDLSNSGNIRIIDNTWLDVGYQGNGFVVTGTGDIADVYAAANTTSLRYPILEEKEEDFFCQGKIQFGDGGATSTTITSDNESLKFKNIPVASTLYGFNADGATMNLSALRLGAAGSSDVQRYTFDMSNATDVTMTGSNLTRAGLITMAAGQEYSNTVFNNCLQASVLTATVTNFTFSNYAGTNGAVLLPAGDTHNLTNGSFLDNTRATEIDTYYANGYSFTGLTFNGNTYDVNNTSGNTQDINQTDSDGSTYVGTLVNFLTSVTAGLKNLIPGSEYEVTRDDTGAVVMSGEVDHAGIAQTSYTTTGLNTTVKVRRGSQGQIESGTVTTTDTDGTVLIDSTAQFQSNKVGQGDVVRNTTDGSKCFVVSVDSEIKLTTTKLSSGTENDYDSGDAYSVTERAFKRYVNYDSITASGMDHQVNQTIDTLIKIS
ncbi:MAG: hypothetical protein KZQ83_14910 [gamma proteobacterium symbiont of Taylorina sp.]|nr:hypothetical protein [gamma proteobacterium symbiont of Taylorina sp.]